MGIPPIPTKKLFPSPDKHQSKKEFFVKIRDTLMALSKSLSRGRDKEMIMRFTGHINPGKHIDPSRLPFEARTDGRSKFEGKSECLFALVSDMMQAYWAYHNDDKSEVSADAVNVALEKITQVAEKGLSAYRTEGSVKKGYVLILK